MKIFALFVAVSVTLLLTGCSSEPPQLKDEFAKSHGEEQNPDYKY